MNRNTLIKVHLALATLFLPYMFLLPVSGVLYLAGFKGEVAKTEAFKVTDPVPSESSALPDFFRQQFKSHGIDFDFESIRSSGSEHVFRPSTRVHYMASISADGVTVHRLEPDVVKRMIELHVGHGPKLGKWVQGAFGVCLILVTLFGLSLALRVKPYRRLALTSFAVGLGVIALCLI